MKGYPMNIGDKIGICHFGEQYAIIHDVIEKESREGGLFGQAKCQTRPIARWRITGVLTDTGEVSNWGSDAVGDQG